MLCSKTSQSVPSAVLLRLHIKQHCKEQELGPQAEDEERDNCRDKNRIILHEFEIQGIDSHNDTENTESDPEEVIEHQRVEPHDDVLRLQPPEKVLQEEPGKPYDVTAVLDFRPFKPVACRVGDVLYAEPVDVEPHEDIVAVAVSRVDGVERDRLKRSP